MENFVHDIPTKVYFGKGQIANLTNVLSVYGKKVLLVYGGGSIKKIGLYDKVMDILNNNDYEFGPVLRKEKSLTFKEKYQSRITEIDKLLSTKKLSENRVSALDQEKERIRRVL